MLEPGVYGVPPGADFPATVIDALAARVKEPDEWPRLRLVANSGRMLTRLREVFEAGPPRLLPSMSLITDLQALAPECLLPAPGGVPRVRRQLDLARLLRAAGEIGTSATAYDLAGSLADLLTEMEEEGVGFPTLEALDLGTQSAHWERALRLARIAADFEAQGDMGGLGGQVTALLAAWDAAPPLGPVVAVGSTGSRGPTARLLRAIARLPRGAVVLPGFDPDTPEKTWETLRDGAEEDHPQYRFLALLDAMGIAPGDVRLLGQAPDPARGRLLSLALRPAPVTHQWLREGPAFDALDGPTGGTGGITLLEARDQREEANAIALRLRQAAAEGTRAALISPDRGLTRRVAAALDRWGIVADDSAGTPLSLTAPGRLLRQLAGVARQGLSAQALIALLKHPLVAKGAQAEGAGRGPHLLMTRALEMQLRRRGPPFPEPRHIAAWAGEDDQRAAWGAWLTELLTLPALDTLPAFLAWLRRTAEALAAGPGATGSGALWEEAAGRAADALLAELEALARDDDRLPEVEPLTLLTRALAAEPMNIQNVTHPGLMIWGTLDARAQGAELVILGGLNEGSWPEAAAADPWLNRDLRRVLGLRSPERQVGLSAHDFQQAAGAAEVWLTRATKSDDAETVPSRWLNRVVTLLRGLPEQGGPAALDAMLARGARWREDARRLDLAPRVAPAPRPAPVPPVAARPRKLSVTEIKTLIRDPYAIYARHVLRLRELDPIQAEPDALLRGTVLHKVMEQVMAQGLPQDRERAVDAVSATAAQVLQAEVQWPAARAMWQARLERVAPWFVTTEETRGNGLAQSALETKGALGFRNPDFMLTGEADRIDLDTDGRARIYDYKTGKPPSDKQQALFDKQLLLEAMMVERGAFEAVGVAPVARAAFIGLGGSPEEREAPLDAEDTHALFIDLIARMLAPDHGFTARRAMEKQTDASPYDLVSRYGEWSSVDTPQKVRL
ncbi:MAG: double-strand break repair protein AddB [Pseudomonadota bacterium]